MKPLYYVSSVPGLEKDVLYPRVPVNYLTHGKYIDWQLPRIQLFENLEDALSAMYLGQDLSGKEMYVYQALGIRPESLIEPSLTNAPYLITSGISEWWYLVGIRLRPVMKIKVDRKKSGIVFHYGPRQTRADLTRWAWHEILEPWERKKKEKKKLGSGKTTAKKLHDGIKILKKI